MPASYRIDKKRKMVFSLATGTLTDADCIRHRDRLLKDPRMDPSFDQLADITQAERVELTINGIHAIAHPIPFGEGSKRAVVTGHDFVFGMARMYQALTDHHSHEVTVFRDMDEARAWLKLPPEATWETAREA